VVITSAQIRQARELLGWCRFQLSQRANLHPDIIEHAESATVAVPITVASRAFVEFRNGEAPGTELRQR
jgi:ribosome-binding protein aMBF1 (putative translation factor)